MVIQQYIIKKDPCWQSWNVRSSPIVLDKTKTSSTAQYLEKLNAQTYFRKKIYHVN